MAQITNAIYSRDEFLYELQWTDEIAEFFIQHTTREALKGKYKHGRCITDYLLGVQFEVSKHFGIFFSFRHFKKKLAELENRYTIFTWIINQPAVLYDEKYKRVYASDEQWHEFKKVYPTAPKYKGKAETYYDDLRIIFGESGVGTYASLLAKNEEKATSTSYEA